MWYHQAAVLAHEMKHNLFKGVLLTMTLVILYSCTSESPSNTDNVQQTRVQQIKDDQAVQLGEELYNSFSYKLILLSAKLF